ncbi:MAG: hypothetical protein AB4040_16725 [Synechococcus sp.]
MKYRLQSFQNLVWLSLIVFLVFLLVGPVVGCQPIQAASLNARTWIGDLYDEAVGSRVAALKDEISHNPIQESVNRREQQYARAYEVATGAEYAGDSCLTLFGLIPLNCPDPSGEGNITADSPQDYSIEECMEVLQLPANLCRQW